MLNLLKNLYIAADYKRSAASLNHMLRVGGSASAGTIVVLLYRLEPHSGGLRNVARIVNALAAHLGKTIQLYIQNPQKTDTLLAKDYGFNGEIVASLKTTADLYVTTSFIFSLSLPELLEKFPSRWNHIIQDYDELFFPISTRYYHAAKVKIGPEAFIASGKWMKLPGRTAYLPFPVDTVIYHARPEIAVERDIDVLFFHKPELPRRCALVCEQLAEKLLAKRPDLRIAFYGSPLSKFLTKAHVKHLGALPSLESLSEVYRRSRVGVSFNLTNPSLIPFEQMACGCVAVSPYVESPPEFHLPGIHIDGTLSQLCEHILECLKDANLQTKALSLYDIYVSQGYLCSRDDFDNAVVEAIEIL
jgi:glycosyltransferase involved in cell wall biosynthesis